MLDYFHFERLAITFFIEDSLHAIRVIGEGNSAKLYIVLIQAKQNCLGISQFIYDIFNRPWQHPKQI